MPDDIETIVLHAPPLVRSSFDDFCDRMAATELAIQTAAAFDLDICEIWDVLGRSPGLTTAHLQTPAGWQAVASHVVSELTGAPAETLLPVTFH